ncbi:phytanoyl-dioxygenase family protein [Hypoxylon rubiginosum]|uniref:Phytanoyl-dioxygenase family protein n=1 Tax=Hypoxylon rubiginosum TaxID=110542 RepID=A0ACC0CYR8_9PEZI|nr:phytanoyl-dioxygenase family protein [Hypoxylon rubiginosum]
MAITRPNQVQGFQPSDAEQKAGKYSPETLGKLLSAFSQDGLVLLSNVIPKEIIMKLNEKMCEDADKKIKDPSQGYNHGVKSNFLQRPPITDPEYLHEEVYFNSFLLQVANAYLGSTPIWNWLTANTALANTGGMRQPAHKDSGCFAHPQYPYYFIANVPLCNFSVESGSTEFWLGSNLETSSDDQLKAKSAEDTKLYPMARMGDSIPPIADWAKEERAKVRPPIQPQCGPGDIMIRDLRTWHAGMPNFSDSHRVMLGLGYQSPHHTGEFLHLHLPLSQKEFFTEKAAGRVEVRAKWYEDEEFAKTKADTVFYAGPPR